MTDHEAHDVQDLLDRYGEAWNTHDLDAILALHTEDTVFALHAGDEPVVGAPAVRESFAASLEQWPDIHFAAEDVQLGAEHATARWSVTATLATPLELDSGTAAPSSRSLRFDAVDVLLVRGGRIARKDTYIDAISLQRQLDGDQQAATA
jgi:steroid delta-isomerase-like uncharacterized protein